MNDKELADRVVALGVLQRNEMTHRYYTDEYTFGRSDYKAVRDWRVAGALIEKCQQNAHELAINTAWERFSMFMMVQIRYEPYLAPELANPRAVIEACVEALEDSDD